jgi:hypothetical protein
VIDYLIAAVICFLAGWSVAAAESLFRLDERPAPFRGTPGMVFLLLLSGVGAALAAGGILWIFQKIPSSAVMVVILGAGWGGFAASNWLNVHPAGAVNRLMLGLAGLLLMYGLVWRFLPPAP